MSHTLFQATLDLARIVANVVEGVATGGSDVTLVDTTFPFKSVDMEPPPDDHYNNGTLWILSCLNANKTAIITDWVQLTRTFSFDSLGTVVAAGDLYAVCNRVYPRWLLRQSVNVALGALNGVDATDVSLTTVSNQISYTNPTGVYNVRKVEMALGTTAPYGWEVLNNWHPVGSTIEFDSALDGGYILRLTYRITPTLLTTDAGTISDLINPELLTWLAAEHALTWRLGIVGDDEPEVKTRLVMDLEKAQRRIAEHRGEMHHTPKAHHFNILGSF